MVQYISFYIYIGGIFNMDPRKIILDVDTGTDDAIAIMLAALHPSLDLLGIGVSYNLHGIETTLENTLRVVELLGGTIPVYEGAPGPLVKDLSSREMNSVVSGRKTLTVDGKDVQIHKPYLDLPPASIKKQDLHAVSWYLQTLKNSKEKITLVATAGLTNYALAIRMDPSILEHIEEIVIMGGGIGMRNITMAAESNFFRDPEAARIVVRSGAKIKIVPLDATYSAPFYPEDAQKFKDLGTPAGELAYNMIQSRIDAYTAIGYVERPSSPIHDAITVASLIDPDVLSDVRRCSVEVDMGGSIADGMLIVDPRRVADLSADSYVAFHADRDKVFSVVYETLKRFKS